MHICQQRLFLSCEIIIYNHKILDYANFSIYEKMNAFGKGEKKSHMICCYIKSNFSPYYKQILLYRKEDGRTVGNEHNKNFSFFDVMLIRINRSIDKSVFRKGMADKPIYCTK